MEQYTKSRRRSSVAPTTGYSKRVIQTVFLSENGEPLKLIEIERRGYVTYNDKNGTYPLTDLGKQVLAGEKR